MSRMEKINELIKREISNIFLMGELADSRVKFVTIQSVQVSKDLQHAKVRFSILSDAAEDIKKAQEGLNDCRGYVRKLVGQRIQIRYTPEIQFYYDKGVQYAVQVDRTLEEIKKLKSGDSDGTN